MGADIFISDAVLLEAVFPNLKKKKTTEELSDKQQKKSAKAFRSDHDSQGH